MTAEETRFPRIVNDPVTAFIQTDGSDFPLAPRILEIHYDFDADGIEDVAFCDTSGSGHRGNGTWDVFLRCPDGRFIEVGFIMYRLHIKVNRAKEGGSFVHTFVVGSAGHDVIENYRITKRGIRTLPSKSIYIEDADDIRAFERIFGKGKPQELKASSYTPEHFRAKTQSQSGT